MTPEYYVFTPEALGMYTRLVAEAWSRHRGVDGIENHEDAAILGGAGHEAIHMIQHIVRQQSLEQEELAKSVLGDIDSLPVLETDPEGPAAPPSDAAPPKNIPKPRLRGNDHEDDGA